MKRFASLFLAAALVMPLLTLNSKADAETHEHDWVDNYDTYTCASCGEEIATKVFKGLRYVVLGDSIEIAGSDMEIESIEIPSEIDGIPVTSIGDFVFGLHGNLTSVTIPDGVTSIGNGAFYHCTSLTNITIPDSVTYIGEGAFRECASLTSVVIPDGVTSIGNLAFWGCERLTSITIPNSVTSIGISAFLFSPAEIQISPDHPTLEVIDGVLFDKVNKRLIYYPYNAEDATYEIPQGTREICTAAFGCCSNLTSVTIPDSVTSIGEQAFSSCNSLNSVTIPDSVTAIGDGAFSYCENLTSVTIPSNVPSIGEDAFYLCENVTVTVEAGSYAEQYCIDNGIPYTHPDKPAN